MSTIPAIHVIWSDDLRLPSDTEAAVTNPARYACSSESECAWSTPRAADRGNEQRLQVLQAGRRSCRTWAKRRLRPVCGSLLSSTMAPASTHPHACHICPRPLLEIWGAPGCAPCSRHVTAVLWGSRNLHVGPAPPRPRARLRPLPHPWASIRQTGCRTASLASPQHLCMRNLPPCPHHLPHSSQLTRSPARSADAS